MATSSAGLNLRLLLLLDSRSPAGGHGHSAGVEAAVRAGFVRDEQTLREFSAARLQTAGLVAAAFAALAHRAHSEHATPQQWARIDAELDARTVSPAMRTASRALGRGLRRLLAASAPHTERDLDQQWSACPRPAPHHALVMGATCAVAGAGSRDAALAVAHAGIGAAASAALRLLGLDPFRVHAMHHELVEQIERVADHAEDAAHGRARLLDAAARLPTSSAPAMDVLAELHLQQEVRLFAS